MTYYKLVPVTEDTAIDRVNIHSAEVAHFTHTTEPWPRTPIRVDQSIPMKPSLCHALSPATPVGYRVTAKPLRFKLWGARGDIPPTDPRPNASLRI